MLSALRLAQVNVSNYCKWELPSFDIISKTIVTILEHSHPITKVLYLVIYKKFLFAISQQNNLSSCFSFFRPHPKPGGKKKNNGPINSSLNGCFCIIQSPITKHPPKMYRYPFSKAYCRLLTAAAVMEQSIVYPASMRIYPIPCPSCLDQHCP